jgi:GNAT superfamily N-acetyltransferase
VTGGRDATVAQEVLVRPYGNKDERAVLDMLTAAMGPGPIGERSAEFFRWKHMANPFGPSFMLVAEDHGRIVALRAFMRWEFRAGGRTLRAVRAVDTATHPDYRRMGLFSRLTKEALRLLEGEADLVFNTPNEKSLPGYLKMGWRVAGKLPVRIRIRRPLRFLRGVRSLRSPGGEGPVRPGTTAPTAAEVLSAADLASLLAEIDEDRRFVTPTSPDYLRWRYGAAPGLDYRGVVEGQEGNPHGLAIFRLRPRGGLWEAAVAEVIVRPGDRRTARGLFRQVVRAAAVDHITCLFPAGSVQADACRSAGFLRSPGGVLLTVNPLTERLDPDPTSQTAWALSLGDVEVF